MLDNSTREEKKIMFDSKECEQFSGQSSYDDLAKRLTEIELLIMRLDSAKKCVTNIDNNSFEVDNELRGVIINHLKTKARILKLTMLEQEVKKLLLHAPDIPKKYLMKLSKKAICNYVSTNNIYVYYDEKFFVDFGDLDPITFDTIEELNEWLEKD